MIIIVFALELITSTAFPFILQIAIYRIEYGQMREKFGFDIPL